MSTLTVKPEAQIRIARPLKVLVPLIKQDLMAAHNAGIDYYRAAGEKLQEAYSQIDKSQWGDWVKKNLGISRETARRHMLLAGELEIQAAEEDIKSSPARSSQPRKYRTLSEFAEPNRGTHQPSWHKPVQESLASNRLNMQRMKEDAQDKEREEKLQRALGLQLIDIGYKVLATKLHPDKGGSREAMARLNRVRTILKGAL